jgi:hypothetical protein
MVRFADASLNPGCALSELHSQSYNGVVVSRFSPLRLYDEAPPADLGWPRRQRIPHFAGKIIGTGRNSDESAFGWVATPY